MMPLTHESNTECGTSPSPVKQFLGTEELVLHLRAVIPGGISKRSVYQWCDMGCPHIQMPGAKKKLLFVMAEVVEWVMSHRVERVVSTGRSGMA